MAYHLKARRKTVLESNKSDKAPAFDRVTESELVDQGSATNLFIRFTDYYSEELHRASNFETDMLRHVNPNCKKVNKLFAWPITPYCETSHDGMKKVYYKLGENFQMFKLDEEERSCYLLPNAQQRRIHLCVDQLSAQHFRCLLINLTKKLSEIGTSRLFLPLLEVLLQFTCVHDYFHDTRMHGNDSIYCSHYGSFLQPFQYLLKQKGITGNPIKKM